MISFTVLTSENRNTQLYYLLELLYQLEKKEVLLAKDRTAVKVKDKFFICIFTPNFYA